MTSVLRAVRTVFPSQRHHQKALAKTMVDFCMSVNPQFPYAKDINKIFDNSRIGTRHHIFPPEKLFGEFKMEDTFETVAQRMGELSRQCMDTTFRDSKIPSHEVTNIISASSFPLSPALDVRAIAGGHGKSVLSIHPNLKRTPMAGIGCAGGVATLARAHEYLKCHPKEAVMTSSVECGSRYWSGAYQARLRPMLADPEKHRHQIIQETVAACLLGDGASNTILLGEKHPLAGSSEMKHKGAHPRIVDSLSILVPSTYDVAGHAAASYGFRVYIDRRLNQVAVKPAIALVHQLLSTNKLTVKDISHWVVHPGGPKIVEGIRDGLGLPDEAVKFSWESLLEHGNCGSVSIMNVLQRTVASTPKDYQGKYGLMIAVGPGVMLEGLLLKW